MTKSPPYCKLKTSFTYKLLVALKLIQNTKKNCKGVSENELAKFMEKNDHMTGDICSQIENSIRVAEKYRLILKKKNGYVLLTPAARLHNIPEKCVKEKLGEIEKAFTTCDDSEPKLSKSFCPCPQRKTSLRKLKPKRKPKYYKRRSRSKKPTKQTQQNSDCEEQKPMSPCDIDDSSDSSLE